MSDSTDVHRFKLVILGDTGVGKTSLAVRFVRNAFRKFETTTGGSLVDMMW
jgi:GTPase SAR1 family protein